MGIVLELQSNSSARIEKAAKIVIKEKLTGLSNELLEALSTVIDKPKMWKSQSALIRAIGMTDCTNALPFLRELVGRKFDSTIIYRDLGFAITLLSDIFERNFIFYREAVNTRNVMLIAGCCSAILYSECLPSEEDVSVIISSISEIDADEGNIITPRCYIAAAAYKWPYPSVRPFLELCTRSKWSGLVDIANSSLHGSKCKQILV